MLYSDEIMYYCQCVKDKKSINNKSLYLHWDLTKIQWTLDYNTGVLSQ